MRQERIKTLSVMDPAIDESRVSRDDWRKFNSTRDYAVLAPYLKPGEFATAFHVRECPNDLMPWVLAAGDDEFERRSRAFRACVVRVDNAFMRDGVRHDSWSPTTTNGKPVPMTDDEAALFDWYSRAEIGGVAFEHSFLARRIDGCFRLHVTLAEFWVNRLSLHVESSPASAAETSSAKPSEHSGEGSTTGSQSATPVAG